ncbi:MAG: N-acetylmuramoyl-L-alanine amidase [Oscillospiraceae bacterium]|jgi:N-acetylmuramoyl-L-alanine amidase|nr:N-acetylmuramoyl-L-alanine amidase [Oscillospiraceae bacterium]
MKRKLRANAFAMLLLLALLLVGCGRSTIQESALSEESPAATVVQPPDATPVEPSAEPESVVTPTAPIVPETPVFSEEASAPPSAQTSSEDRNRTQELPEGTPSPEQSDEEQPRKESPGGNLSLAGYKIGIDAGHQGRGNSAQEPVSPGSEETKAKVTSGTQGRFTGVAEHTVNLNVALLLEEKLLDLGAEVVMVRRTPEVDISNVERATMMNDAGVDIVIRIHADGSEDASVSGASMHVPASQDTAAINDASRAAGEVIFKEFISVTGAKDKCVVGRRDLSGFNWSTVPAVLIELGFMTNEEEDRLLTTPEYQELCAEGLARGIVNWSQSQ